MRTPLAVTVVALALVALASLAAADAPALTSPIGRVVEARAVDVEIPLGDPLGDDVGLDATGLDGAGTEFRDTPSGGPSASKFVHLESATVCGAPCRVAAANDELIGVVPAAGTPDFPFRWPSAIATLGVAGGSYAQSTVFVDTNGHLAFQDPVVPHPARAGIPNLAAPNAIVAANWQDLDPSVTSGLDGLYVAVTGTAPNRVLIVEWWNVPNALDPSCRQQFEIALFEAGYSAEVYYLTSCTTFSASGGEESSGGAVGVTYFNGIVPQNTGVRYKDVRAPGNSAMGVTCAFPGSNNWCRSSDVSIVLNDNQDVFTTQIGIGVKTRTYRVDAGATLPVTRGASVPLSLAEGQHAVTQTTVDHGGNTATTTHGRPDIDLTPPTASVAATCPTASTGPDGWCRAAVTTSATSADSVSGIWFRNCRMDGVARTCNPAAYATNGVHTWVVDTGDVAGWTASASRTVKVDTVPPAPSATVVCDAPGAAGWCRHNVTFTGAATDATSGVASVTCRLDGVAVPCATGTDVNGFHTFQVTAVDVAGHSATTTITAKIDSVAPDATAAFACAQEVGGVCVASPLPYVATATDATSGVATLACTVDGAVAACAGDLATDGAHSVHVVATDAAGNSATASASMTLDTGAPVVDIQIECLVPGDGGWCRAPSVAYVATATDATTGVATFECALDGAPVPCAGDAGGEGAHVLDAAATDAAGHATLLNATFSVDSVPPALSSTPAGPEGDNGWFVGDVAVTLACSDATSGVASLEQRVDGGEFAAYAGPVNLTGDGVHVVEARCRDAAGHETTTETTVRIDTVGPDGAFANPAYAAGPYNVTWTATDATSGVALVTVEEVLLGGALGDEYAAACTTPVEPSPGASGACERDPSPGVYCYRLRVRDAAGHEFVTFRANLTAVDALEAQLAKCTLKATPGEIPEAAAASVGARAPEKLFV